MKRGKNGWRVLCVIAAILGGAPLSNSAKAATTIYDWRFAEDASLLGWTITQEDPTATVANGDAGVLLNQDSTSSTAGPDIDHSFFTGVGQNQKDEFGEVVGSVQDAPHETLILTSEEFALTATSAFSFMLTGGMPGLEPFSDNISGLTGKITTNGGFAGFAVRDVATGDYLLTIGRTENGSGVTEGVGYETVTLSPLDLQTAGLDLTGSTKYVMDFVDDKEGSWGWTKALRAEFTDVAFAAVPEPKSAALLLLALGAVHGFQRIRRVKRTATI